MEISDIRPSATYVSFKNGVGGVITAVHGQDKIRVYVGDLDSDGSVPRTGSSEDYETRSITEVESWHYTNWNKKTSAVRPGLFFIHLFYRYFPRSQLIF